eukprot:TRINITY_DN11306_c0_g2_i1.p1 TRINITY_DN11306_c0_g2~~TRINITY_DN11306_c0_g2_i1.p1  ORF type:complete len:350 (+),score=101.60 TRINITY_DN11306_c0_g2_i1:520-1569(+)
MVSESSSTYKNIKEYELGDYMELGEKLGEAMFYFVKFQSFVEQFEKVNQHTSIKALAANFSRTKSRRSYQPNICKQPGRKTIIKNERGVRQPVFESAHDKEIFQDILEEYKSNYEKSEEDSDDSYDENVMEEEQLNSLISINYQLPFHKPLVEDILNPTAIMEKVLNSTIVRPLSYDKSSIKSNHAFVSNYPISNRNLNYEPKKAILNYSSSQYNRSKQKVQYKYSSRIESKPYKNNLSNGHVKRLDYTSIDKVSIDNPLPLLQSIKWKAILKRCLIQNCSQIGPNERYFLGAENFDELRVGCNAKALSIHSQKMHLFKRMNSNVCRRNVVNSQLKTRNMKCAEQKQCY